MLMERYIDEINEMLFAAYAHGGDSGGPYGSEAKWMKKTVERFLKVTELDKHYSYGLIEREGRDCTYFNVPQIITWDWVNEK